MRSNCKQLAYTCHEQNIFGIVAVTDNYQFTSQPYNSSHFIIIVNILAKVRLGLRWCQVNISRYDEG